MSRNEGPFTILSQRKRVHDAFFSVYGSKALQLSIISNMQNDSPREFMTVDFAVDLESCFSKGVSHHHNPHFTETQSLSAENSEVQRSVNVYTSFCLYLDIQITKKIQRGETIDPH
ncbi:hypothetical protein TNCT_460131 [Trichonephila clavata]|uniref:Uncharacterized protein n=1 Tax=Trichonephila clavata TaxID=2740835 RepID=A0A8X6KT66_TRICU|nr:hypothetical protein TNCT_460131 [Trichonephila clavata]